MKSPLKLILPLMLIFVCVAPIIARAQKRDFPRYVGHVNDFANIVDAQTEQQLETILNNFEKLTGAQIAVVTIQSLNERVIEDYAVDLYRAWGIGAKSGENKDKGALLLVALQDRKTRLEVGYGLEGDLPDGLAGEIIRRMRPFLQQQQYSMGVNVGVRTLVDTLAQKWNVSLAGIEDRSYAYQGPQSQQVSGRSVLLFLLVFGGFLLLMAYLARRSGKGGGGRGGGGWYGAPIIFNRGGGTFGGGSWGNSGSNGGSDWGGFGGGGSGGGGATDSW